MLVRELMAILAQEHPESPVAVEGLCPHGDYLIQSDLEVLHDEGPAPDLEEVSLCWTASEDVEQRYRQHNEAQSESRPRRLP